MKVSDYLALDEDGRKPVRAAAIEAAKEANRVAAGFYLTEAAAEIRQYWPDAVGVVIDTQPYEHFTGLHSIQAAGEQLLWTRRDGLVDPSQGDDDELGDVAHDIAQDIAEALGLSKDVLAEIATWMYVLWLDEWLNPDDDMEAPSDPAPPAAGRVVRMPAHQ